MVVYLKDLCATCGKPISRTGADFAWEHDNPLTGKPPHDAAPATGA